MQLFEDQYQLVKESRKVVLEFCCQLPAVDYVEEINHVGVSIRHLHVHVANTYIHWVGKFALKRNLDYVNAENYKSATAVVDLYETVDQLMEAFIKTSESPGQNIANKIPGKEMDLRKSVLEVFTHVITHEFHHKGQVMRLIRRLGYTPPDADVIRF